jgi:hypothetical protein
VNRRRLVLFGLLGVFLAAGAGVWLFWPRTAITRENAAQVQVGMTLAEVEAILGGPARLDNTGPEVFDIEAPGAEAVRQLKSPEHPDCVRMKRWVSDTVALDACFDREGRVVAVRCMPMLRESDSPLDMIRRWLRL